MWYIVSRLRDTITSAWYYHGFQYPLERDRILGTGFQYPLERDRIPRVSISDIEGMSGQYPLERDRIPEIFLQCIYITQFFVYNCCVFLASCIIYNILIHIVYCVGMLFTCWSTPWEHQADQIWNIFHRCTLYIRHGGARLLGARVLWPITSAWYIVSCLCDTMTSAW